MQSPTISDLEFNSANFTAGFPVGVFTTATTVSWHDGSDFYSIWSVKWFWQPALPMHKHLYYVQQKSTDSVIMRNFAIYDRVNDMFLFLLLSQLTNPFDILLWTLIFMHDLNINLHFW